MSDLRWFGKSGVVQLANLQKASGGISPLVYTMIAAYKQLEDVEYLLKLVAPIADAHLDKIRERHQKYSAAQQQEQQS